VFSSSCMALLLNIYSRLKDCDVTWLYGPLQPAIHYTISEPISEPLSNLSKSNSFLNKKPILKKRSMSEMMLQKSLSTSSLIRQAAAAVQAQQSLPPTPGRRGHLERRASDYGSMSTVPSSALSRETIDYFSSQPSTGLHTPAEQGDRKHIRFDDKVEQRIAVEIKDGYEDEDEDEDEDQEPWANSGEDDSSDEGVLMMRTPKRKLRVKPKPESRRNSMENRLIAELPSTTLKYRTDSPDISDTPSHSVGGTSWRGRLSPSPSLETLRPSHPSRNFLIPEEDDEDDNDSSMAWEPSIAFGEAANGRMNGPDGGQHNESDERFGGMRRTESGMFMPYEDGEGAVAAGILGKVVDTVNTARDIAHVIWNVGWRR
jgi:hypothetical protein